MTLVATFLINAALAFALSLAMAAILGPDAFGRYAIGLSIAITVNTILFEWLRLSTIRFQSERAQAETPSIRRTIDLAYWVTGAGLAALTLAALVLDRASGVSRSLLAAAAICGLAYGLCEYRMALARALFREGSYVALTLLRAFFGFAVTAVAAHVTGDPAVALVGSALSSLLPILIVRRGLRAPPGVAAAPFDREALAAFARYAAPLFAASAVYQLMPLLNRSLLAGRDGFVEAGYFSLVSDIATRLFQNLGAALDIVLFQIAVRADEKHGRAAAERQIARNAAIVTAIVLPSAMGLWMVWPSFEAVFIPHAFRGHLGDSVPYLIPALGLYSLILFALNPFFQLRRRTGPVAAAAVAAIGVNLLAVLIWPLPPGAAGFALAQFAGLAAGFAVLLTLAIANGARLPWRDFAMSALAAIVMGLVLRSLRDLGGPAETLAIQVALGGIVFALLALAVDLCGSRRFLIRLIARRVRPDRARRR